MPAPAIPAPPKERSFCGPNEARSPCYRPWQLRLHGHHVTPRSLGGFIINSLSYLPSTRSKLTRTKRFFLGVEAREGAGRPWGRGLLAPDAWEQPACAFIFFFSTKNTSPRLPWVPTLDLLPKVYVPETGAITHG